LVKDLSFNAKRSEAAISEDMFATDVAVEAAASGVPFREAYQKAAHDLDARKGRDATQSLKARTSPGAPGDPLLDVLKGRLFEAKAKA
jgi:argininosuccinate lyase